MRIGLSLIFTILFLSNVSSVFADSLADEWKLIEAAIEDVNRRFPGVEDENIADEHVVKVEKTLPPQEQIKSISKRVVKVMGAIGLPYAEGLIAYRYGSLQGFKDIDDNVVIEAAYSKVNEFSQGLAAVEKTDRSYIFIDKKGQNRFAVDFYDAKSFSEGLAAVIPKTVWGKYGFIDQKGKVVIEPKYADVRGFSDGLAAVKIDGKYGYINKKGKLVIDAKYDFAASFSEGYALVGFCTTKNTYGGSCNFFKRTLIDKNGKEQFEAIDMGMMRGDPMLRQDRLSIYSKGKQALIDHKGMVKNLLDGQAGHDFANGYSPFLANNNLWGYINLNGKVVVPAILIDAKRPHNGWVAVKFNKKESYRYLELKQ